MPNTAAVTEEAAEEVEVSTAVAAVATTVVAVMAVATTAADTAAPVAECLEAAAALEECADTGRRHAVPVPEEPGLSKAGAPPVA